jgi:hypothetical protein
MTADDFESLFVNQNVVEVAFNSPVVTDVGQKPPQQ